MKPLCRRSAIGAAALGAGLAFTSSLLAVPSAEPAPAAKPRAAVANLSFIFNSILATRALLDKLKAKGAELTAKARDYSNEIDKMVQDRDRDLNPKHPQYKEATRAIHTKKAEYQSWELTSKADFELEQKEATKGLYDRMDAAIAQVAKQNDFDLVIADTRRDIEGRDVDSLTPEEFRRLLNARTVLYSTNGLDISERVIAVLDQQFLQENHSPPVPAPAPK